jgi:hypothetical protein
MAGADNQGEPLTERLGVLLERPILGHVNPP